MFGFLKSSRFSDETLGQFIYRSGLWMGNIELSPYGNMPLRLEGEKGSPDETCLEMAKCLQGFYPDVHKTVEAALYEHFLPRMQAIAHKQDVPEGDRFLLEPNPKLMWSQVYPSCIDIQILDDKPTVDIVYRVEWDENRQVAARIIEGEFAQVMDSHDGYQTV